MHIISSRDILIPLTIRIIQHTIGGGYIGYRVFYVFGIRIAKVQITLPWD